MPNLSGFFLIFMLFFEMLVVFQRAPRPTPTESTLRKQPIAEVLTGYLVFELLATVYIGFACRRLNEQGAVFLTSDTGVVERIDVDGQTLCMLRQFCTTFHHAIAVARSIVGTHGTLVIVAIFRDRTDALNGIFCLIKFFKDCFFP